ncbi:MAG: TolC family protein [Candidatus Acidiferrales bacterium]
MTIVKVWQQFLMEKVAAMKLHISLRGLRALAIGSLLIFGTPALLRAQASTQPSPLTLQQAVNIALEKNPERKAALADAKAASAGVSEARAALLPDVAFSETATRGNDPVYVFGSKLRQQRFTTADFELNVLNTPTPYGNFATGFGGTWNLFDSFGSWHAVSRAERVKESATHQLERTGQEIIFHVVNSYYGALLAKKQLEIAEDSRKTAQAILDLSKNRFESGIAVESDLLSARVRIASRKQTLVRAQDNLELAQAQLSTSMGISAEHEFIPTEVLSEEDLPVMKLADAERSALESRPDLKQIQSQEAAQQQNVAIAKSAFGPQVNAFAGWEADNPTFVAGGGGNNWLAGIEVKIDLFDGGAKRARLARERAVEARAAAVREAASDAIRLEIRRAYYDLDAARQQIEVARASIADAKESLRINQNRYDSGLSTITDLLAAEEAAQRSETDYWEAVYRYHIGYASLELASGTLNPHSPVVTP